MTAVLLSVLALVLGACSSGGPDTGPATPAWAPPWPQRPVVSLAFDVAPDLTAVTGHERVVFTPDAPICELVFRAWPNTPTSVAGGASLVVTRAALDGRPTPPRVDAAGAPPGAPGTLVTLPLPRCSPAGRAVTADLDVAVRLGADADDRLGTSPTTGTAWWGSAYPLLAWVRGQGWSRTPAPGIAGENAVSEEYRLADLDVTAPDGLAVAGAGVALGTVPGPRPGTTTHRFTADAVRDVTVSVGRYDVLERDVRGVRLHLFTPTSGTRSDPDRWVEQVDTMIGREVALFGPFPYRDLWVSIVPPQSTGTEYPGALQVGDARPRELAGLVGHELGHQWFYALVGDDQGRHPWIDEAFATSTEAVVTGQPDEYGADDVPDRVRGRLGDPMTAWSRFDDYDDGVYVAGAAALLEGRRQVGAPAFDAAVRAYVARHAHGIAAPSDVADAFAGLPAVTDQLTRAGALGPPG